MKKLLDSVPDLDNYLAMMKVTDEQLNLFGIKKENLKTLKDMTDLAMLMKALKGDPKAKQYCDEMYAKENTKSALNG